MGHLAPPQVIGRYAIFAKIASGGMASVHLGRLLGGAGFSRTVAIKRLHPHLAAEPEFIKTLIDEARLAARIHHPNVVPTLDVVATENELLVVMEYVRGESLSSLLKAEIARGRRVPLPIVSAIAISALHGLHAAHEATSDRGEALGIVHRDVSPQNILVGVDGVARIIDFGVAKAAGRLQSTSQGVIKGKMAYIAPEQVDAREVTRAADLYSLGIVLWEMLAGKRLFQGESAAEIFAKVIAGASNPPSVHAPDLPAGLDDLVMMALRREPAERFVSAQAMAEKLLSMVPPAYPTDVGKWVSELASGSLARRGTLLAEIESSSRMSSSPPPGDVPALERAEGSGVVRAQRGDPSESARGLDGDEPSLVSQPSSLSMETPGASAVPRWPSRRMIASGALAAGVLLLASVGAAMSRGGARARVAASVPSAIGEAPPYEDAARPPSPASVAPPAPDSLAAGDAPSVSAPPAGHPKPVASVVSPRRPAPARSPSRTCTVVTSYDSEAQPHFKEVCK